MDLSNPAIAGLIGVFLGAVITGVVTIGGELLRGKQAAELDSEKRRDDRRLHRDELQRQTLLDLQEALNDWMRIQTMTELADVKSFRESGRLGRHGPELEEAQLRTARRMVILTERVLDDDLRTELLALRELSVPAMPQDEDHVRAALRRLMAAAVLAHEHIGRVLRSYLDAPSS